MKMVKSLLLGSAAGFVAVAGAQAADLPMKAKAVEYVKVCSLYGAGYYYIPGSDTCIKVGGYVRADYEINANPSGAAAILNAGDARWNQAETRYYNSRVRYVTNWDVRTQTEYGTLRAYWRYGFQYNSAVGAGSAKDSVNFMERAMIQFAGFTFGKSISLFDFYMPQGVNNSSMLGASDTGNGITQIAYTAMLGNGVSASIAVEDPQNFRRANGIWQTGTGTTAVGSDVTTSYGGLKAPDVVGVLRVDQAWGNAQIGAVAHQVLPGYYSSGIGLISNGGPGTKWGWAVGGGVDLNLPWAKGDRFIIQGTYTEGVLDTVRGSAGITNVGVIKDTTLTQGYLLDAVFGASPTSLELTTAWAVVGGLEHYWTPSLRSSVFGTYVAVRYNATAANYMCTGAGVGTGIFGGTAKTGTCNPDLNLWQLGARTVWNPVKDLDLSVEGLYTKVEQNNVGTSNASGGVRDVAVRTYSNYDTWGFNFRVQRNFNP
jgi:hypothetical protein